MGHSLGGLGGLRKGSVKPVFKPNTMAFRAYLGLTDPFPALCARLPGSGSPALGFETDRSLQDMKPRVGQTWLQTQAVPLSGCVLLRKSLPFSKPPSVKQTHLLGLLGGVNKMVDLSCLTQCLELREAQ